MKHFKSIQTATQNTNRDYKVYCNKRLVCNHRTTCDDTNPHYRDSLDDNICSVDIDAKFIPVECG